MAKDFSIIIPCYNEGDRLGPFLVELICEMQKFRSLGEIVVVDDGSCEEDKKIYQQIVDDLNSSDVRLVQLSSNQGKGAAVHHGFKMAQGKWIGFVDADGATNAKEVFRVLSLALNSSGLSGVLASRILMLGYEVQYSILRYIMGRVFVGLVYKILHVPVYDSQCGCKFFNQKDMASILGRCQEKGFLFDIEIIALGHQQGLKFLEVPVSWIDMKGSKVHVFRDSLRMFMGLWKIRRRIYNKGSFYENKE